MIQFFQNHMLPVILFGYVIPALIVAIYTVSGYLETKEMDCEGLTMEKDYVPILSWEDHAMFYGTILIPFANIVCTALILGLESSDAVLRWAFDRCEDAEYHRQEHESERDAALIIENWGTTL